MVEPSLDNLNHILAGLLGAELVVQVRARRGTVRSEWARLAYFASAAGNNLPDLDFLYARLGGPTLGYLMHHRGHTHTLALGIPLGGALFAALLVWARRRGYLARPGDATAGSKGTATSTRRRSSGRSGCRRTGSP